MRIAECGAGCQQLISDLVACSRGGVDARSPLPSITPRWWKSAFPSP